MSALELIAVAFSLASVVLAARRHAATWPAGIIAVAAYFVVFVRTRLYADAALQVVFLLQGAYGWMFWTRSGGHAPATERPVATLTWPARLGVVTVVAVAAWTIGAALSRHTDASSPHLDAIVSVLSLAANWLLARRLIDTWALWVSADVLYVGLFASKGLMVSAALYAVFLVLALGGWRSWWHARVTASDASASPTRGRVSRAPAGGVA